MSTQVKFASKGSGQVEGALAEPTGSGKAAGLVVVQEWWGINPHVKSLCDRFAQEGFLAVAPDLFHGVLPSTKEQAAKTMNALDKKKAVAEVGDAVAWLKTQPRCNGKVGVIGFCLGGALTFAAARYVDGISAAVPFYGLPETAPNDFGAVRVPIQAHFGRKDDWAKASVAEQIQKSVRSGGGQMDLFVYDAGHAFMRAGDGEVYDDASAKVAWKRAVEFLKSHLG
jgi:carboxymethylenebutenolidase